VDSEEGEAMEETDRMDENSPNRKVIEEASSTGVTLK
jgi:hypothetical protein